MDFFVMVRRGEVYFPCKSEEQLNTFVNAGYEIVEEAKEKIVTKKSRK